MHISTKFLRTGLLLCAGFWLAGSLSAQNFIMNGTPITSCDGFFLDSGGGSGDYSPNESLTTVICADGVGGSHVRITFPNPEIGAGDELLVYDGSDATAPLIETLDQDFVLMLNGAYILQATAANTTGCLTFVFNSDGVDEGAGWSSILSCVTACQNVFSEIVTSTPTVSPPDTGYIDICPGETVFFSGRGIYPQNDLVYRQSDNTSQFIWEFGDGLSAFGPNVSHRYNEPGGYVVQLTIIDTLGCNNINLISQRVRVAPKPEFEYRSTLPTEICVGDSLELFGSIALGNSNGLIVNPTLGSFPVSASRSDSIALPDGTGVASETSIFFSEFSPGQTLTDIADLISICVNMEHSFLRDLEISISCPNGTSIVLHDHPGRFGGRNYLGEPNPADDVPPGLGYDYCWTPGASDGTWLEYLDDNPSLLTLPAGDYETVDPITDLVGCPLNGEWTISVIDLWGFDDGFLFNWGVAFNQDLYPEQERFQTQIVNGGWLDLSPVIQWSTDSILAAAQNAGTAQFTFQVEDSFGCTWDTLLTTNVLPPTHPDCFSCPPESGFLPNDTTLCAGGSLELMYNVPNGDTLDITFETFPNASIGNSNHPPVNPFASIINVNSIEPATLTDAATSITSLCLDYDVDFVGDIQIYLQSPSGEVLELSTNNGGGASNYRNTCFTPTATTAITAGTAPFTGNFLPEGNWAVLNGATTNGNWELLVSDGFGVSSFGTLNSWSITFGAAPAQTFDWTDAGDLSCDDCPFPTYVGTSDSPTVTTVTINDSYGCSYQDTIQLRSPQDGLKPEAVCTQDSLGNISVSWVGDNAFTDYSISIDNGGFQMPNIDATTHQVSGLSTGDEFTAFVTGNLPAGSPCTTEMDTVICRYSNCNLNITLSSNARTDVRCFGDCTGIISISSFSVVGTPVYSLTNLADGSSVSQPIGRFQNLCAGDYLVTVIDSIGCEDTLSVSVMQPAQIQPTITIVDSIDCFGQNTGVLNATATGGRGSSFDFVWNDPLAQAAPTATMLTANQYIVVATDSVNCVGRDTIDLPQPPPITLDALTIDSVLCNGGSTGQIALTAIGGTGVLSYQWSAGTTPTQNNTGGLMAGPIDVQITDFKGCLLDTNFVIPEPLVLSGIAQQTDAGCFGETGNAVEVVPSGGTPNYTIAWSTGTTGLSTMAPAGPVEAYITDRFLCRDTVTFQAADLPEITVNLIGTPPVCEGSNDGAAGVNIVQGGSGMGYTYRWNTTPPQTGMDIMGLEGGQLYVVTVTDSEGCVAVESIFLEAAQEREVDVTISDVDCFGGNTGGITINGLSNSTGMLTYQWGPAAGNNTTNEVQFLTAGTYTVDITDALNCTTPFTFTVNEPDSILVTATITDNECAGESNGSVALETSGGNGGYQYAWASVPSVDSEITQLAAGDYDVLITDALGCSQSLTYTVGEPEPIQTDYNISDIACIGDQTGSAEIIVMGGTTPFRYSLDGITYNANPFFFNLEAGTYPIFISDGNDCVFQDSFMLTNPDTIGVDIRFGTEFPDAISIDLGDSISLFAVPVNIRNVDSIGFQWRTSSQGEINDSETSIITVGPLQSATYIVELTDENGCEVEDQIFVEVRKDRIVLVPTGFSPNGDSNNERLPVLGKDGAFIDLFRVFDRWGELVYEATEFSVNDPAVGWDGRFRGEEAPAGVYIWYIEASFEDGFNTTYKGQTTLIR